MSADEETLCPFDGKPWGTCEHCTCCGQPVVVRVMVTLVKQVRPTDPPVGTTWREALCAECWPAVKEDEEHSGTRSDPID